MVLAGGSQLKEEDAGNGEAESLARDWADLNDVSSEEIVEFDFGEMSLPRFSGHLDCGDAIAQRGVQDDYEVPA